MAFSAPLGFHIILHIGSKRSRSATASSCSTSSTPPAPPFALLPNGSASHGAGLYQRHDTLSGLLLQPPSSRLSEGLICRHFLFPASDAAISESFYNLIKLKRFNVVSLIFPLLCFIAQRPAATACALCSQPGSAPVCMSQTAIFKSLILYQRTDF